MHNHWNTVGAVIVLVLGFVAGWLGRDARRSHIGSKLRLISNCPPPFRRRTASCASSPSAPIPTTARSRSAAPAAKWAAQGHHVKFVSVTNGDIGHWQSAGGPLARRRLAEVERADQILGIHTQVLDIHDGELEPTLENRRTITRLIREWKADIVLAHRPNDYHPDHRYTGILVQDAAFMVTVPFFCPDVPHLKKNPVFLYYSDRFERPNPFRPDIVVDIDDVIEKKLAALDVLESQFFEGGVDRFGGADWPRTRANPEQRRKQVRQGFMARDADVAQKYRDKLVEFYGKDSGGQGRPRRGVRDHRIRQPADARRTQEAVSVLRAMIVSVG